MKYLIDDRIITDQRDIEHFKSEEEYRGIIKSHMLRKPDTHHLIYFVHEGKRIGAASYNTFVSEDGKCFILDFWLFPEHRNRGLGHQCFAELEKHTRRQGAQYYVLNSQHERSIKFWNDLGFIENGVDEYGVKLFILKH